MKSLASLWGKESLRVIGLMSGTSADGMDAALTDITGSGPGLEVRVLSFVSLPYPDEVRHEILRLASGHQGGSRDLCLFSFLLGRLALEACLAAQPQLVILPKRLKDAAASLAEFGIPALLVSPESGELLDEMITLIGEASGAQERAAALIGFGAQQLAALGNFFQLSLQRGDAPSDVTAVAFQLGLTGTSGADAAAQTAHRLA